MKKTAKRPKIDVNFQPGNYRLTSRALNFNFKKWRLNQKLSVGEAAFFLGASYRMYIEWEETGVASSLTPILFARTIDCIYEMRRESPGAFDQFIAAMIRVEEYSKGLYENVEHAKLVRARQKATQPVAPHHNSETTKASGETEPVRPQS
jgi:hypothetical protein